ncbi:CRP-like cAMP-activated global transcriptional regulator [Paraconexibacter sp. AEG42_29]|uniref:CRP-like cAMP-activated global transcriptional regulator n=1 Tax=Paraconexibacter sp. AEG42_29 TaxID=2997339 RepID=A0AAU7ATW8_9ACTN
MSGTAAGRTSTFLDALSSADRETLRSRGTVRRFARGAAIAHAGQLGDRVLIILDGHVRIARVTEDGRDVLLAIRGPGDLVGEQSALDGLPRSATITALGPVESLALGNADFLTFVTATPAASLYVMRLLAARLRDADAKRVGYTAQDVVGRLAARLCELSERFGEESADGVRIDLPLTQEDLAGWVGASREATARALGQMRELGWVSTARRAIVCHDLDALRRRSTA